MENHPCINNKSDTEKGLLRITHLILDLETSKASVIGLLEKYFPQYKFNYIVIDKSTTPVLNGYLSNPRQGVSHLRITSTKQEIDTIFEVLDNNDYVVFHSLFISPITKLAILIHNKYSLNKIIWLEWGYDFYIVREHGFVNLLRYYAHILTRYLFDKKIPYFIGVHPADVDQYKILIKGTAYLNWVPYLGSANKKVVAPYTPKNSMQEKIKNGQPIVIQIGHRAWEGLNHQKWLNRLSVYKHENIKVLLPLSYGDPEYADFVQSKAYDIFGEKVTVLRSLLPSADYYKIIENVDILILDSDRQIGLANLNILLRTQKKIYLSPRSSLYTFFKSKGINIMDINVIGKQSFADLCTDVDMNAAAEYMYSFDSFDNISRWSEIFNDIFGEIK